VGTENLRLSARQTEIMSEACTEGRGRIHLIRKWQAATARCRWLRKARRRIDESTHLFIKWEIIYRSRKIFSVPTLSQSSVLI